MKTDNILGPKAEETKRVLDAALYDPVIATPTPNELRLAKRMDAMYEILIPALEKIRAGLSDDREYRDCARHALNIFNGRSK